MSYPELYPDVEPNLEISVPPNAPQYPYLDIAEDKTRLLDSLRSAIEESLGMAMIFTLVSALKDSAETLISERISQAQNTREIEAKKVEEEENRKFHGTPVTGETFLEWRAKFWEEMAERERREKEEREAEERKKRGGKPEEKRLTGKEIWERGLAGNELEDEEVVDGVVEGVKKMRIEI